MAPLLIGALVGGGLGLLKGQAGAKKNEEQDKYRKAAMIYSPWTGMGDVGGGTAPGMADSIISGAAGGAMVGNMFPAGGAVAPGAGMAAEKAMAASTTPMVTGTEGAMGAASGANPAVYGKSLGGNLLSSAPGAASGNMLDQANIIGGVDYARQMNPYLNFPGYNFKPQGI